MLSALAYVLQRAMAQQKMIESAKLAPMPDLVQSNKDVAINFFGDMEICTRKGVLSERFSIRLRAAELSPTLFSTPKPPTPHWRSIMHCGRRSVSNQRWPAGIFAGIFIDSGRHFP